MEFYLWLLGFSKMHSADASILGSKKVFYIRHSEYVFHMSPEVYQTYFLFLLNIYCLYIY